jgi:diketogulonate reductase-like aldo/keto reductase
MAHPSVRLNTGAPMPLIGFGAFAGGVGEATVVDRYLSKPLSKGGAMQPLQPTPEWEVEAEAAVAAGIDAGYRHIDTAFIYGTEPAVGRAIAAKLADGTLRSRSELFVTTKLTMAHHKQHLVLPALRRSLANLGLDYIDLYLVHAPIAYTHDEATGLWPANEDGSRTYDLTTSLLQTWRGMEGVAEAGLARAIGVSNFSALQLARLAAAATVVPAVNQVESHPFCVQEALLRTCQAHGVTLSAYSPLGGKPHALFYLPGLWLPPARL